MPPRPNINHVMNLNNIQQYLDDYIRISFDESRFRTPLVLDNLSTSSIASRNNPTIYRKDIDLLSKTTTQGVKLQYIYIYIYIYIYV